MTDVIFGGAGDLIVRIGAIAGALVVTFGAVSAFVRFSTKKFVAGIREVVEGRLDEIKANTEQLRPNGGSSIADAIRRVEARQIEISGETKAVRAALEDHLAEHRAIN